MKRSSDGNIGRSFKRSKLVDGVILEQLNIRVPHSLVIVAPFLEEGLHVLRQNMTGESLLIALSCFNHAFSVLDKFDLNLDTEGIESIISFKKLAGNIQLLMSRMNMEENLKAPVDARLMFAGLFLDNDAETPVNAGEVAPQKRKTRIPESTHREIILAEATSSFELAEKQLSSGMVEDAARLFHTAAIYLLMADNHNLTPEQVRRLELATARSKECANATENFVHEHSGDLNKFTDHYIEGNESLGKGNFGSVSICIHKKTKDRLARKVS